MARAPARRPQGSVLLLSIFFLVLLFFLAMAFLGLMPVEMRAAGRERLGAEAFFAADAGLMHALAWLETRAAEGSEPIPGNGLRHEITGPVGSWIFRAVLEPDEHTPPRGDSPAHVYEIRSTAFLDGDPYRTVSAMARQETFARFAWFEDRRDPSLVITPTAWHFDGPFHSNARIRLSLPSGYYDTQGRPTFTGGVTTSLAYDTADGVDYGSSPPWDAMGNPLAERYQRIYEGGRDAVRTSVKAQEMPSDATDLSRAAWGSAAPPPTEPGLHVGEAAGSSATAGGLYVVGDVDSMVLAVETGGNRSLTVKQGSRTTKVIETTDAPTSAPDGTPVPVGSTLVLRDGGFSVHPGITNGTVYATGNIRGLQGTNKGKRTVAVDLANQREISLGGPLLRADTAVGSKPEGSRDSLGVVAYKIRVPTSIPRSVEDPLVVYAALFAGTKDSEGGLYIDDWDNYQGAGKLQLFGGLMQSYKPAWARIGADGQITTGMTLESHYDPLLASSPPPHFPTIGKFRLVSYRDEPAAR